MALIVQGFINKEVADKLNIGLSTVITHRKNIMEKLGLKSVSALTIYAVTHGYVDVNLVKS
jgi:DNA-binding NarL/FixJ family response regulator